MAVSFHSTKGKSINGLLSEDEVRMAVAQWLQKLPASAVSARVLIHILSLSPTQTFVFQNRWRTMSTNLSYHSPICGKPQSQHVRQRVGYTPLDVKNADTKKDIYWDGHKRPDVIADHPRYLEETEAVQKLSREWIEIEGGCHGNEHSDRHWLKEGQQVLRRKDPGRLMTVSEFITGSTPSGRLVMSKEQINEQACLPESERLPPNSRKIIFPTGKPGDDSYWNMDQMIAQIKETIRLGEYLLPNTTLVFVFDRSSGHNSRAADALHVNNINVYPGGIASIMRDTTIPADNPHEKGGQPQVMQFTADLGVRHNHELRKGQPKGIATISEERGFVRVSARKVVRTADGQKIIGECEKCKKAKTRKPRSRVSMLLDLEGEAGEADREDDLYDDEGEPECCLRKMLARQSDFPNEKSLLYQTITTAGHKCIFLPKFHCELNPIEYYWAWVKRIFREKCHGNFANSKRLFAETLDACPGDVIRRFLRRTDRYASVYRLGATGPPARWLTAKKFRSHRRSPSRIYH